MSNSIIEHRPSRNSVPENRLELRLSDRDSFKADLETPPLELDFKGVSYQLFALLLSYPDGDQFHDALGTVRDWLYQFSYTDLVDLLDRFLKKNREALVLEYVSTFDFNESRSLYLTSHELGDSRSRGPAMVALRNLLRHYGYEEASDELPDFLPLLLEFVSELPPGERPVDLEQRIAKVCREIYNHLPLESLYRTVFAALARVLPQVKEVENPFPFHEKADTDELPYPLMYD